MRVYQMWTLFFIPFLLEAKWGLAQVADSSRLHIHLSLNGNITEGNSARWILINRARIDYTMAQGFLSWEHSDYYIYGKVQGRRFENNLLDRTFLNFNASGRFVPFLALFLEYYPVRNQDLRWQLGGGSKYKWVDKQGWLLQTGLMYSYSAQGFETSNFKDFDNGGSSEIENTFLTPILNFKAPLFKGKLILSQNFWYQLDLSATQNHRHFYEGKVLVKLNKNFGTQVIITNYWENIIQLVRGPGPQGPPIQKNDFVLAYGLSFDW